MQCARCRHDNPGPARFCTVCGAPLALSCASCGALLPEGVRFCGACGLSVDAQRAGQARFASPEKYTPQHLAEKILTLRGAIAGERKQVTVLFADLKGSMELLADRDPEETRKLLDPVLEFMMDAVHQYEGTVNQVMGDGIMALFGAPVAHEDHAVRACYAALRMQESVKGYAEQVRRTEGIPIQMRVGLNSGEVVVRSIGSDLHMDYTAVGQTTHLAARMEQMATPGSVLTTAGTLSLAEGWVEARSLGALPVKGLEAPLEVFEIIGAGSARSRLQASVRRGLSRFVGRAPELDQIREAIGRAAAGRGQVVAVVGEPGVGKSRLFHEIMHELPRPGWLVFESRSISYGKATPYLPIAELLKGYFQIEARDSARQIREKVTGKLLILDPALEAALPAFLSLLDVPVEETRWQALDPSQRRQRTLDAVKSLLLRESQAQPVVLVFEDLQWVDSETQALLDSLVESLPLTCIALLVNFRPEYSHGWASKSYYSRLRLNTLQAAGAGELLEELLGSDPGLGPPTHAWVVTMLAEVYPVARRRYLDRGLGMARAHKQRWLEAEALRIQGQLCGTGEALDLTGARAAFEEATAIARDMGLRPLFGRCRLALDRALNRAGEHEEARGPPEEAAALFTAMDMRFWLDRAQAALGDRPGR